MFGAFFLILAIVVGALILSRYLFSLNFERYIHQVELENLQRLVPALQDEFRSADSWEGIRADTTRWKRLLRTVPDIRRHAPLPPPPGENPPNGSRPPAGHAGLPPHDMPPPGGPPQILLMDVHSQPVIGTPGPNDQRRLVAIEVDGQTVGWLGLRTHEPFKSGPPAALLERQAKDFYLLGAVVIGLTALIAFMFSRHLLRLSKQRISPCELLVITLGSYRTRLAQCGIAVRTMLGGLTGVRIKGDADRLGQVFTNILENACRYVQPPGRLEISGTADAREVRFYFQDSGPGVPDDALSRLFDRLYRVDASRSRGSGGSGLGLSICLQIIEGHGGKIWAQKSPLGGLSIGIKLPVTTTQNG